MITASEACRQARMHNDEFMSLKDRVWSGIDRACQSGKFEARVALQYTDRADLVEELVAQLGEAGYRVERAVYDGRQILVIMYSSQRKDEDDEERAVREAGHDVGGVPGAGAAAPDSPGQ